MSGINTGETPELPECARLDLSLGDGGCKWLDEYIAFSKKWSPRGWGDLHAAAGLWVLSTIAARRIHLNLGGKRFTNLYFALVADTSSWGKSTTSKVAKQVIKEAGFKFLLTPDEMTPQAFIKNLSTKPVIMEDQQVTPLICNKIAYAGQRGWYYEEFGQKVQAMMKANGVMNDYRGLLRSFDDGDDEYTYDTISRGEESIHDPYLSLIGNTTPADLRPFAGAGQPLWRDGFWARFVFISPAIDATPSRARFPEGERVVPASLIKPLIEWNNRLGVPDVIKEPLSDNEEDNRVKLYKGEHSKNLCTMDREVVDAFYNYDDALAKLLENPNMDDLRGNYTRLPEKAMRVAILFASLENNNRITIKQWAKGQEICEAWRSNLHTIYTQLTGSVETTMERSQEEAILRVLAKKSPCTIREIVQSIRGLNTAQVTTLVKSMVSVGMIVEKREMHTCRYILPLS